jgi:hypothetical protein
VADEAFQPSVEEVNDLLAGARKGAVEAGRLRPDTRPPEFRQGSEPPRSKPRLVPTFPTEEEHQEALKSMKTPYQVWLENVARWDEEMKTR